MSNLPNRKSPCRARPPIPARHANPASRIQISRQLFRRPLFPQRQTGERLISATPSPLRAFLHFLQEARHQRRPPRLVARPATSPGIAVEILVEQHQIPPVRIGRIPLVPAMARPPARPRPAGTMPHAAAKAPPPPPSGSASSRTARTLHLQRVAIEMVVTFQRLDQQVVDRKPDRPAPVRIPAEQHASSPPPACSRRRIRRRPAAARRDAPGDTPTSSGSRAATEIPPHPTGIASVRSSRSREGIASSRCLSCGQARTQRNLHAPAPDGGATNHCIRFRKSGSFRS